VAAEAKVTLVLDGAGTPAVIMADADQITQVLHNLIENAVKYGAAGGRVRVALQALPVDAGLRGPALQITVQDWGEGIDPIHLPRLTERFYRVDSHRSRERGGTGLGLAIVKHIVNRHRGRLRIDSERGGGSTFVILLPAP
jgi:two-component system phosphate regulon sensor histidine kinase PhoR